MAKSLLNNEVENVLEVRGISKAFSAAKALDGVSICLKAGEVLALVGENGAGKSTLVKILAGVYTPDEGDLIYQGDHIAWRGPLDAKQRGVILIHQELSLVPDLSVAENIYLGSLPLRRMGRVDWSKLDADARVILDDLKCDISPRKRTGELSIAVQQMVEIARALAFQARVIIFDEPTASLTNSEKDVLFENINDLVQRGVSIIYISHKLNEIFEISNEVTVLRDGKVTGTMRTSDTNTDEVTQLMIGRTLDDYYERKAQHTLGKEILRVDQLADASGAFSDISFSIREGEVLGLCGLIGAGRSEVAETIFGIRKASSGSIFVEGKKRAIRNSSVAVNLGMALVPEDRKLQGLVLDIGVKDNMMLANLRSLQRFGFVQRKREATTYEEYKERLSVSVVDPKQPAKTLSGGNQQKVVISKWLSTKPKLLILDEPTRGIDVGTKAEIHKLIRHLAEEEGYAVLVISSEMPEIMGVSDRIITMYQGTQTGEFSAAEATEDKLIRAIMHKAYDS